MTLGANQQGSNVWLPYDICSSSYAKIEHYFRYTWQSNMWHVIVHAVHVWQSVSHLANGPWKKRFKRFFTTKFIIPKSLKVTIQVDSHRSALCVQVATFTKSLPSLSTLARRSWVPRSLEKECHSQAPSCMGTPNTPWEQQVCTWMGSLIKFKLSMGEWAPKTTHIYLKVCLSWASSGGDIYNAYKHMQMRVLTW